MPDGWDDLRAKLADADERPAQPRRILGPEAEREGRAVIERSRRNLENFDAMVEDEDSPQMLEYALERWTGHRVRAFLRRLRRRPRS